LAPIHEAEAGYLGVALAAARAARQFLEWMEQVAEQLAPERSVTLAAHTHEAYGVALQTARDALEAHPPPVDLTPFAERFTEGFGHITEAFALFTSFPDAAPPERISRILAALHHVARAQEIFYLLRAALAPFAGYWQLPDAREPERPARRGDAKAADTGVIHVSAGGHHGGFALYVPESYTTDRTWPVIVALHGGSGNGRDFLWTWVREAKSLGYLLVAPSAVADTWSEVEDRGLLEILVWLERRYRLAGDRVLLTGLSDGATFALLYGLAHPQVYRALAPLCGVLHPANEMLGNLTRARGVPIYLVHGALDFLFPVQLAHHARDALRAAGAALEYRELAELSHTYPRSENVRILRWFEALPPPH